MESRTVIRSDSVSSPDRETKQSQYQSDSVIFTNSDYHFIA